MSVDLAPAQFDALREELQREGRAHAVYSDDHFAYNGVQIHKTPT